CRRLTDFDDSDLNGGWAVVNDGVMGGRSRGAIEFTDSAMRFRGDVVTAGGGFTSVRLQLTGDELTGSDSLVLRVRSDERTYGLTLQDTAQTGRRSISHGADLTINGPADADRWQTAITSHNELLPSVFGQPLDAPGFDPDQAVEIGIIISDGIDGPFNLEIDWIDACSTQ
ncbi:CIA30 family protein, partial [Ilumatobacter sp.]|uniref:CIA30 family protein n=1 Tax=Ilumatobacter sp. TaxID=1967498 RepID=UPI0030A1C23D